MEHSGHVYVHVHSFYFVWLMQVWFRVNGLLPDGLQKSLPDTPPEMLQTDMNEGVRPQLYLVIFLIVVDQNTVCLYVLTWLINFFII